MIKPRTIRQLALLILTMITSVMVFSVTSNIIIGEPNMVVSMFVTLLITSVMFWLLFLYKISMETVIEYSTMNTN